MKKPLPRLILSGALTASAAAAASDTLRCGSRLVSVGDTRAGVLIKCGEPAWKDDWTDAVFSGVDAAIEHRVGVARERWSTISAPMPFWSSCPLTTGA